MTNLPTKPIVFYDRFWLSKERIKSEFRNLLKREPLSLHEPLESALDQALSYYHKRLQERMNQLTGNNDLPHCTVNEDLFMLADSEEECRRIQSFLILGDQLAKILEQCDIDTEEYLVALSQRGRDINYAYVNVPPSLQTPQSFFDRLFPERFYNRLTSLLFEHTGYIISAEELESGVLRILAQDRNTFAKILK